MKDIPSAGSYNSLCPRNIPYYPGHHPWSHLDAPVLPHGDKSLLPACALASQQSVALGFPFLLFCAQPKSIKYSLVLQQQGKGIRQSGEGLEEMTVPSG